MASMFYQPAVEILKSVGGLPLSAGAVKKRILTDYPSVKWSGYQGPIRAMLLSAAENQASPIKLVENSSPPLFYYEEVEQGHDMSPVEVRESIEEVAEKARSEIDIAIRQQVKDRLCKLTWQAFEDLIVEVISRAVSGKGHTTQRSRDHGIDGFVTLPRDPFNLSQIRVQAKHRQDSTGRVNEKEVTHFIGALNGCDGIIVTNAVFAKPAINKIESCKTSKLVWIDGDGLVDLMVRYGIGMKQVAEPIVPMVIDEDFLKELGD